MSGSNSKPFPLGTRPCPPKDLGVLGLQHGASSSAPGDLVFQGLGRGFSGTGCKVSALCLRVWTSRVG